MDLADRIGTLLRDTYRIERVLGEGGMGVVFVARHERLGSEVAIKFLQPELARDASTLARFFEEARAAARLEHPNVIRVHDVDTEEGVPFMVMELLRGESLAERLRREGTLSVEDSVAIAAPILLALEASHRAGIVHRDIKPDNIFLAQEAGSTVPKLLDFGIAKLRDGERKTATGVAIGTPAYMAPEQAAGRPSAIGPWTDVWSVAVVVYECLSGRMHYEVESGGGMMAWLTRLATEPPRSLRVAAPDVPDAIAAAVDAALQPAPAERTRDAGTLRGALLRASRGLSISHGATMAATPQPLAAHAQTSLREAALHEAALRETAVSDGGQLEVGAPSTGQSKPGPLPTRSPELLSTETPPLDRMRSGGRAAWVMGIGVLVVLVVLVVLGGLGGLWAALSGGEQAADVDAPPAVMPVVASPVDVSPVASPPMDVSPVASPPNAVVPSEVTPSVRSELASRPVPAVLPAPAALGEVPPAAPAPEPTAAPRRRNSRQTPLSRPTGERPVRSRTGEWRATDL